MDVNYRSSTSRKRLALAISAVICAASIAAPSHAQDDEYAGEVFMLDEIIVTGFRTSLQNASAFKRNSVNITDSVFSEDVGKFPDLNIAEAINRVPGIQLSREIDGSGVNVAIRGLNTNFTKVTLNGAQIAVASSGKTDATNSNRELDLDVFPTEFFSRLDVSKTPVASMLEGGLSGTVNMRSLRPMDTPHSFVNYQMQAGYGELSEEISPRGSLIGSWQNSDRSFGVLAGIAAVNNKVATQGYETIGWTNANLTEVQCGGNNCNTTGGNGFVIGRPTGVSHVTPANTVITGASGMEYEPGTVIDRDFLLDVNPDASINQIANGLIPRLGRPHYSVGDRDRIAGLLSMEWIPRENASFFIDFLYAEGDREYNRLDMMLVGRNSELIPTNMQVDDNNIVTHADFHNAQFLLEARPYRETLDFYSINPGAQLFIGDEVTLDISANTTRSTWFRESPSVGVASRMGGGVTAEFMNAGGDYPRVRSNIDLNDPNQVVGWEIERALIQNEARETDTLGARFDVTIGDHLVNWKFGLSYDELDRSIAGLDNSEAWRNSVNSAVGNAGIANYLLPGPAGFVTVDYPRLFDDTNYHALSASAEEQPSSATGAPTGSVEEKTLGAYLEANREYEIRNRQLRVNGGFRYVATNQEVTGLQALGDDFEFRSAESDYRRILPAFNLAYDLTDGLLLRGAISRTLTRANPTDMMPVFIFNDQSAQFASQGNPQLEPFTSNNFDIGLEWYSEAEAYASINYFRKQIEGFTYGAPETIPFTDLGIPLSSLSGPQQTAINQRGGPQEATINMVTPANADGRLNLNGVELLWVQPLPMVVEGLGYSLNLTNVQQSTSGEGAPTFATGVSKNTFNATTYYETDVLTLRLSYVWYDEQFGSGMDDWGVSGAQRFIDPRGQWDFSGSYEFPHLPTSPKITLNLINIGSDPQREVFAADNAAYTYYNPGFTAILGIRGVLY